MRCATRKTVFKTFLENERGESIQQYRRRRNIDMKRHFMGGRRPLERKWTVGYLQRRFAPKPKKSGLPDVAPAVTRTPVEKASWDSFLGKAWKLLNRKVW